MFQLTSTLTESPCDVKNLRMTPARLTVISRVGGTVVDVPRRW
jgi:hypothetical protein